MSSTPNIYSKGHLANKEYEKVPPYLRREYRKT